MGSYGSPELAFMEGKSFAYSTHNAHVTCADLDHIRENDAHLSQIFMELEIRKDIYNKTQSDSDHVDLIQAPHPRAPQWSPHTLSIPRPHPLTGHKELSARALPAKLSVELDLNLINTDPAKAYNDVVKDILDLEPSNADLVQGLMDVTVSHIEAYNSFWIRLTALRHKEEREVLLRRMEAILGIWSTDKKNLTSASLGQHVLVSNGNRGMHRAKILHVGHDKDHIRVELVDYGSKKNYILSRNSIYPFPQEWSLGSCGDRGCGGFVLVSPARMPEVDYGFLPFDPTAFRDAFRQALKSPDLRGTVQGMSVDGCFEMKLEYGPEHKKLGPYLATLGVQRPIPCSSLMDRCGNFAVTLGMDRWILKEFTCSDLMYMWPEGVIADRLLQWIKNDLHFLLDKMPPVTSTIPQVKDIVGVRLGSDWFRAEIHEVNFYHGVCKCFLLDLGRMEKKVPFGNIRPLVDERAFRVPALAVECREADVAAQRKEPAADDVERHAHNWMLDVHGTKMLKSFIGYPLKVQVLDYIQKEEQFDGREMFGSMGKYYAVINLYVPVDGKTEPAGYGDALRHVLDARNSDGTGYTRSCTVYNIAKMMRDEEGNGQDEGSDTE